MMERGEGYSPPEAENFRAEQETPDEKKGPATDEGRMAMRGEPVATGLGATRIGVDGNLITPEKTELYHSPETTPEIEPGFGPNASRVGDPNDSAVSDAGTVGSQDPGGAAQDQSSATTADAGADDSGGPDDSGAPADDD